MGAVVDQMENSDVPIGEPIATLNVVAPPNVKKNECFTVLAPSGESVSVPMPADVAPGEIFTCIVPPHVLQPPQALQQTTVTHITQITNV